MKSKLPQKILLSGVKAVKMRLRLELVSRERLSRRLMKSGPSIKERKNFDKHLKRTRLFTGSRDDRSRQWFQSSN
ncbi:hypothetical protein OWV82_013154 [Melia azedarach]|uniref:Uncharacterized protein n=1 Tax=Melia azedarach TaxID=155640 RepID=A0ACC1XUW9_MELAZ|nr:hypothetical protein OWV82_013154 [Melia azedarach]